MRARLTVLGRHGRYSAEFSVANSNRLMALDQSNIVRYKSYQRVQLQTANLAVRAVEMVVKSPCSHGQRPMLVPQPKCHTRLLS
jgi:hypothetical protein